VKTVEIKHATVQGIEADYVHSARTDATERRRAGQAADTAKEVSNKPGMLLSIGELRIIKSAVGFVNTAATPPYRVFMTETDGVLKNLTNHEMEGKAEAKLTGKFMGTGSAIAEATFEAEKSGPAFDIAVRIENVSVPAMNDLLRAYGRFDAAAGRFSFFTELSAKDGRITGYVKPLFKDMKVYAPEQEKGKPLLRKVYERVVGSVAKLLENRQREEVATKGEVSGRIDKPQVGVVEVVVRLIQNAFFEAILPGFDAEVGRAERVRRAASR
jgi:hypothetical protein